MSEKDVANAYKEPVPYIVYESAMVKFERTIKRLVILVGISILLLFVSNAIWVYEWNQYDYQEITVDSQDGSNANYVGAGASGVINNVKGQSKDEN